MRFDLYLARITWIGHSTVLIELDGVRLLTDPVFRPHVLHLRRVTAAAEPPDGVDAVLVSHAHYDHLDINSLTQVSGAARVVVPAGIAKRLRGWADDIVEVDVGDELEVGAVSVTATAAEHGRHAVGFVVTGSARIYFAGDTDLFDGMRELAPGLDVALLPIAGWGPRLPPGHLDPARAAQALQLLRPRIVVPIHWGTYTRIGLSRDETAPARRFAELAATHAPDVEVHVLPVGGSLDIPVEACVR
ncbi:MAG: MBL fold metallo-hydrolase [Actinobacteria bacterium]|nr:MAG: MBL fold metallo-hydrolase [Actinomycetota bacterium]